MSLSETLIHLVNQLPDPDERGMYCENIDKEQIEKTIAEIAGGGAPHVGALINMLGEPGSTENVKPHYALHCVVNHALITKDEDLRCAFCETMAEHLRDENLSDDNRAYLCQELQWAGRDEACPALGDVLLEERLTEPAAMALAAIGGERAGAQLRAAAPRATGKCRLNVIDALAALADPQSVSIFEEALRDQDREVRLAAGAGLAQVGASAGIDPLLEAADCEPGWERIQQTKHCMVLAEKLAASGNQDAAARVYQHLRDTRTDAAEEHIRAAAEAALG